jgi:hypothetical protein
MQRIFIFGNGNLSFEDFLKFYQPILEQSIKQPNTSFLVGDFRGVDTLCMEWLKCRSSDVSVYHLGHRPRYHPDQFKTLTTEWTLNGYYDSNLSRDLAMVEACTHFLGFDFNSDAKRTSGTHKNIQACLRKKRIRLM